MQAEKQFITVVMPALNEERYIARAILSLTRDLEDFEYELLVLDGGSQDYTAEIVQVFAAADSRIRLVMNEKRIQAAGVNKAASLADPRSRFLVRADCHADYPPGFIRSCVDALERSQSSSVVVPMRTVGSTCFQKAVAVAQNSRLGNGGSSHRLMGKSGFIDHGHHAVFRLEAFRNCGGYDENFSHNEDAELDLRLAQAGERIWLNGDAPINYYPRSTVHSLAKQYFMFGRGRARTIRKHRAALKIRQVLPLVAVALAIIGCLGAVVDPIMALIPVTYISAALFIGAMLALRTGTLCAIASGFAALVMHASWAFGFAAAFMSARSLDHEQHANEVLVGRPKKVAPCLPDETLDAPLRSLRANDS